MLIDIVLIRYKNPKLVMYVLHNLRGQKVDFQYFIFCLKVSSETEDLISSGTCSHIFEPRYDSVSIPKCSVRILELSNMVFLRKLYIDYLNLKTLFIISGES